MIKIDYISTSNWEAAIRSMRNPLNSWDKSDSGWGCYKIDGEPETITLCLECGFKPEYCGKRDGYFLGPNDYKLALQLATAGSDHGKFLRSIIFSCDITAPMYWWKEMDTYKVSTVRNSCSTMHKIMEKPFSFGDFSCENIIANDFFDNRTLFLNYIARLTQLREEYIAEEDPEIKKNIWYSLIQLLPSSYNQKATWTANYEVLRNIYHARKNHKLDEWHVFCHMIEKLPYSELITEER